MEEEASPSNFEEFLSLLLNIGQVEKIEDIDAKDLEILLKSAKETGLTKKPYWERRFKSDWKKAKLEMQNREAVKEERDMDAEVEADLEEIEEKLDLPSDSEDELVFGYNKDFDIGSSSLDLPIPPPPMGLPLHLFTEKNISRILNLVDRAEQLQEELDNIRFSMCTAFAVMSSMLLYLMFK